VSDSDRFHRDDPARTHPRRNMSEMFRSDDPWRVRPADEPDHFRETAGSPEESIEQSRNDGVDDAYRIADENMRGGQRRAGQRNQQGYDWRSSAYGSGYDSPFGYRSAAYNSPYGYGYGTRPLESLFEQIIRTYMDMMGVVGTMVNGLARPPYPPYPPYPRPFEPYSRPFERGREPDFRHRTDSVQRVRSASVRVEVASNQTNHVALDLKALQPGISLSVPPLRALNNGKPELHDIRFERENDRSVLRIHIPDGQPPGLYSGVIVEKRSGEPCGTLAIQVGRSTPTGRGRGRQKKES
jgi:hypothetical protein